MSAASPSPTLQRILVRSVNWLGDVVMTTPALERLREAQPQARITVLAPQKLADLYLHLPSVSAILTFQSGESPIRIARRLRAHRFQVALLFPNSPRAALETFFAGIPWRVGYAHAWRRWLLTQAIPRPASWVAMRKRSRAEITRLVQGTTPALPSRWPNSAHQIHHYLHLAASLGANPEPVAPRLVVTEAEVASLRKRLDLPESSAHSARAFFGLHVGAEYGPAKRWPLERFVQTAAELHRRTQCRWLLLGGPGDVSAVQQLEGALKQAMPGSTRSDVCNLAGQTTLRELCTALRLCAVVLTNDSGPMHIAAAVGAKVIVPFGSTSPELTGPGLPGSPGHACLRSDAPCAPCFLPRCPIDFRCMQAIPVEAVVQAALELTS